MTELFSALSMRNFAGIHWAYPERWLLFFLLMLVVLFLVFWTQKKRSTFLKLLLRSQKDFSFIKPKNRPLKTLFFIIGFFFLALSYIGPQWGQKPHVVKTEGLDICFAMDLSRSMLTEDLSPNRLKLAKNQLALFLPELSGDRAALVGFAGTGYIAAPLTQDYFALQDFLEPLHPDFISDQSTSMKAALESCSEALGIDEISRKEELDEEAAKVVVLITDGEDTAKGSEDHLKKLKSLNIPIFSIAVGTKKGGPIPLKDQRGNSKGYLKKASGQPVLSRLKDKALIELAKNSSGRVFYAEKGAGVWKKFQNALDDFERKTQDSGFLLDWEHRYQIFLFIAFLFLFVEFLVTETGIRRKMLSALLFLGATSIAQAAPWKQYPKTFFNNRGVAKFEQEKMDESSQAFDHALRQDASDLELQYNWATQKLWEFKSLPLQSEEEIDERVLRDVTETYKDILKKTEDSFLRKKTYHQLAQSYEAMKKYPQAIEYYYKSLQGAVWEDLDPLSLKNLALLLKDPQSQSGAGGGGGGSSSNSGSGKGGKGDQQNKQQPKEGAQGNQKKKAARYQGTDYSESEVKKILQSVGSEEKDVQRRKARSEAQKKSAEKGGRRSEMGDGDGRAPQY